MNYHHLTIEERSCIRKYYVDGLSYREIARLIGRNVSTARSILPTPIVPGRKAQTRISTACSGSFIRKAETFPVSLPPR